MIQATALKHQLEPRVTCNAPLDCTHPQSTNRNHSSGNEVSGLAPTPSEVGPQRSAHTGVDQRKSAASGKEGGY